MDGPELFEVTAEEREFVRMRRFQRVYSFSVYAVPGISAVLMFCAFGGQFQGTIFSYNLFYQSILAEGVALDFFFLGVVFFKERMPLHIAEFFLLLIFMSCGIHGFFAANNFLFTSFYHRFALIAQLSLCHLLANPRMLLLPNVLNLGLQLLVLGLSPALQDNLAQHTVCFLLAFALNMAVSVGASAGLIAESRAQIAGRAASEGEAITMNLLSAICDAVVLLRPDLQLKAPSPKLNAMLLRQGTSMAGTLFTNFIHPEDVGRFEEFIETQTATPARTGSFHCHLVDATGTKVAVQFFHSCTMGHDGKLNHAIGINEESQERDHFPVAGGPELRDLIATRRVASEDGMTEVSATYGSQVPSSPAASVRSSRAPSVPSSTPSAVITNWGSLSSGPGLDTDEAVTVDVLLTLSVEVVAESEASQVLFAFTNRSHGGFEDHFQRSDTLAKLKGWLAAVHNSGRYGSAALPSGLKSFGKVQVSNPLSSSIHLADLKVSFVTTDEENSCESDPETSTGVLNQRRVRLHFQPPRARRSSRGAAEHISLSGFLNRTPGPQRHRRGRAAVSLPPASHGRMSI